MQGGGVAVNDYSSADFTSCALYGNTANVVRARIFGLLDPSAIAPLNADALRCFYTQGFVGARI